MNLLEAMNSGRPFAHADMIGAYQLINGYLIHRDDPFDFGNVNFILQIIDDIQDSERNGDFFFVRREYNERVKFSVVDLQRKWFLISLSL